MLWQKVSIRIRLNGVDVKKIQKLLKEINIELEKEVIPEFHRQNINFDNPNFSLTISFIKKAKVAKSAADSLKANATLNLESTLFREISEFITEVRVLTHSGNWTRGKPWLKSFMAKVYELAKYMDELLREIIAKESKFIGSLQYDLSQIESSLKSW